MTLITVDAPLEITQQDGSTRRATADDLRGPQGSQGPAGPAGEISVQTASVELTTDDSFGAEHTFDCGRPALVYYKATLLSADLDGETWATQDQDGLEFGANAPQQAHDDIYVLTLSPVVYNSLSYADYPGRTLPAVWDGLIMVGRYVQISMSFVVTGVWTPYAGPNHPSANLRIDIEWV